MGTTVYGIYFDDRYSLAGSGSEYALYVGDTNAENWFSDGFRIGTDADQYKISANGLTTGAGMLITSTGTITTTGNLLTLTANSATTAA